MNSPMNDEEKMRVSDAMHEASNHTLVLLSEPGKDRSRYGIGSGVMAIYRETKIVLSVDHMIKPETIRLIYDFPGIDANSGTPTSREDALEARPLYRNPATDSLVIDGRPLRNTVAEGLKFYDLAESRVVTAKKLSAQVGGTVVISGFWGAKCQFEPTRTPMWMLAAPPYQAKGAIRRVSDDEIVARFEEHAVLHQNVDAFPQLKDVLLNIGGSRDLRGISGSGLWAICPDRIRLIGLVRGPEGDYGDPNIRFTPIWTVLKELDERWKVK